MGTQAGILRNEYVSAYASHTKSARPSRDLVAAVTSVILGTSRTTNHQASRFP